MSGPLGLVLEGPRMLLLSVYAFCAANYAVPPPIPGRITRQIGVPPFDFRGNPWRAEVHEQLPLYTEGARALYRLIRCRLGMLGDTS